jgi:hypothetical protein
MDVRMPDGTLIRGVPDGTTREQLLSKLQANGISVQDAPAAPPQPAEDSDTTTALNMTRLATPAGVVSALASPDGRKMLGNAVAGMVRGAGSVGATVVAPYDMAKDAAAGKGLSLESNRQRRADMDEALTGLGADPNSGAYQVGKVGTEIAGTLPIGGAVGGVVGKVAPRLGQAIASGGFSTGARVAPGVGRTLADVGIRAAGGAINGGLTAGAINPDDAPMGAAMGGAIPVVTKAAGAAGRAVGAVFSPKIARTAVAERMAGELGDDVQQVVSDIQTYYPKGAENIPVSAAAATKNPKLAQMEQGSRLRSSPEWHAFDVNQSKAAYGNVLEATKEADDLAARAVARRENWQQAWSAAEANQKPRLWRQRMTQFGADLRQAELSPEASNPNVRGVINAVNNELDRIGPNFTPSHLQQLRANLNGKVNPMSPDAFKSAPRDNPAIISLKQEMDDILNTVTGGKWQKVIEGYAKDSEALHASKAAQRVRNAYTDAETGRVVAPVIASDVPRVTAANLNSAMNAARMPDKSLALSPQANQRLEATLEALRRQGMVQEVKRSATAGGGSDTVSNAITSGIAQASGAPSLVAQMVAGLRGVGMAKRDQATAQLLSNPDELAKALDRLFQPRPVNPAAALAYRSAPAIAADQ